jgi:hypothetical protein
MNLPKDWLKKDWMSSNLERSAEDGKHGFGFLGAVAVIVVSIALFAAVILSVLL